MTGSPSDLIAALRRTLDDAVRPALGTDPSRQQMAAVIETLAKLERMVDWSASIRAEERAALMRGNAAFRARAASAGLAAPDPAPGNDLEVARADARCLTDWLLAAVPTGAQREQLDSMLRAAMREAVAAERRHIPRADFSAMTQSKEP
jgi:hypothetical protein